MTPAIALEGVRKQYDEFALHDIDLELPEGQVMGLVGVNGAGKSTLLRLLMGLVRADGGKVEVFGQRLPQAQVAVKRGGFLSGAVPPDGRLHGRTAARDDACTACAAGSLRGMLDDVLVPARRKTMAGFAQCVDALARRQRVLGLYRPPAAVAGYPVPPSGHAVALAGQVRLVARGHALAGIRQLPGDGPTHHDRQAAERPGTATHGICNNAGIGCFLSGIARMDQTSACVPMAATGHQASDPLRSRQELRGFLSHAASESHPLSIGRNPCPASEPRRHARRFRRR